MSKDLGFDSLEAVLSLRPDYDLLWSICEMAVRLPFHAVRRHWTALETEVGFHAPSPRSARAAVALATAAISASREADDLSGTLLGIAIAAARIGIADAASVGLRDLSGHIVAGFAVGRIAATVPNGQARTKARRLALHLLMEVADWTPDGDDPVREIASGLSECRPWMVIDRAVVDELASRAVRPSQTVSPPEPVNARVLLKGRIPDASDRETKSIIERYRAVLEQPVPSVVVTASGIDEAMRSLAAEMPHFATATSAIHGDLTLAASLGGPVHARPLLLVGPPGLGKSRWCRRLGELLGVPMRRLSLAGAADSRLLTGTARGWSTATPGGVVEAVVASGVANPILLGDELDKAGGSERNGRIHDALLALLERETARSWFDECLRCDVDLSGVTWLFTANSLAGLPSPLLSRIRVIPVSQPPVDAFTVTLDSILAEVGNERGVDPMMLPQLTPEAMRTLRTVWSLRPSPRALRTAVDHVLGVLVVHQTVTCH
jgi:hypothetical protein